MFTKKILTKYYIFFFIISACTSNDKKVNLPIMVSLYKDSLQIEDSTLFYYRQKLFRNIESTPSIVDSIMLSQLDSSSVACTALNEHEQETYRINYFPALYSKNKGISIFLKPNATFDTIRASVVLYRPKSSILSIDIKSIRDFSYYRQYHASIVDKNSLTFLKEQLDTFPTHYVSGMDRESMYIKKMTHKDTLFYFLMDDENPRYDKLYKQFVFDVLRNCNVPSVYQKYFKP